MGGTSIIAICPRLVHIPTAACWALSKGIFNKQKTAGRVIRKREERESQEDDLKEREQIRVFF